MAETSLSPLGNQLGWSEDIHRLLQEAQHRWLRPPEICQILSSYKKFRISPEPQNRPPSGSIFLFDRKVTRYFRKDGHSWRKKKDGKTVREAHERLKSGSIDVLHCYYAHGEGNENFQRRTYWMLEEELLHVVLVHYRDVKGSSRASFYRVKETAETISHSQKTDDARLNSEMDTSASSNYHSGTYQMHAQATNTENLASGAKASEYEDVESAYESRGQVGSPSWENGLENCNYGTEHIPPDFRVPIKADNAPTISRQGDLLGKMFMNSFSKWQESTSHEAIQEQWQRPDAHNSMKSEKESELHSSVKHHLLDGSQRDGLKKLDSFNRWMSNELGDVDESPVHSTSATYWQNVKSEDGVDNSNIPLQSDMEPYLMAPSLANDQLFSIIDFSPSWVYVGTEVKVLIIGRFLKSQEDLKTYRWSCMFGEVEVAAEVIAEGVLRFYNPLLRAGRIPFYVTCSNRTACSEVCEFEFRDSIVQDIDDTNSCSSIENIQVRFGKLLCTGPNSSQNFNQSNASEISQLSSKIRALLKKDGDEWDLMLKSTSEEAFSAQKVKDQLLQKLLKEKLHDWLLQKVVEGGKGPSVLDEVGQGVLHLAAALGYDWALEPTTVAGVRVDFRDLNGWTALHWAASCGRERTVASLINLGAAPGALTDPTPRNPTSITPADLASTNGHKGIAGFLAEFALTSHFITLSVDKRNSNGDVSGTNVQMHSEACVNVDLQGESMKESLAAVRNAAQAAARLHQVFRVQSFQRKQVKENGDGKLRISEEQALSLIKVKGNKKPDEPVEAAAVRIQNKFRSWKGRREFLVIRQQIVKIQAHVKGHQVRKNYRKILWSVGIVEKVILRWRRKRSGLRGFKPELLTESSSIELHSSAREDEYDFFKEGRKQTEERSRIALARVKSMVQYPEARDQYCRLRNQIKGSKSVHQLDTGSEATKTEFSDIVELESLSDHDIFMPTASPSDLMKRH